MTYYSTALKKFRRMHVYTPPGYETGSAKYPVFYLLHGAGDCDDSWTSVGRAGFILDNLIAAKKAKPMVVVMPAGHTSTAAFGGGSGAAPAAGGAPPPLDEFTQDFLTDIMPYAETHYRVLTDRATPRDRRPFDGRQPDSEHRHSAPGEVRLHRRLQFGRVLGAGGGAAPGRGGCSRGRAGAASAWETHRTWPISTTPR